jgi:hypothetical protein
MGEPDVTQQETQRMTAVRIEGGDINAYALLNDLIRKEIVICNIVVDDRVRFHVKHLHNHGDGWIECAINKDIVLFITKRVPLTLYVNVKGTI